MSEKIHPSVTPSTYTKVTVSPEGHITAGTTLVSSDIPPYEIISFTSGGSTYSAQNGNIIVVLDMSDGPVEIDLPNPYDFQGTRILCLVDSSGGNVASFGGSYPPSGNFDWWGTTTGQYIVLTSDGINWVVENSHALTVAELPTMPIVTLSGTATLDATFMNKLILADLSLESFDITFPSAAGAAPGPYTILNLGGGYTLTLLRNGSDTFGTSGGTHPEPAAGELWTLVSDGTSKWIVTARVDNSVI